MEVICEIVAGLGNVPVIVGGDLNTTIEASTILSRAIAAQSLHGLALVQSNVDAQPPEPTCYAKDDSPRTRIDFLLANSVAINAFRHFSLRPDIHVPVHCAIEARFAFSSCLQKGVRYRKPSSLPAWQKLKDEEKRMNSRGSTPPPCLKASLSSGKYACKATTLTGPWNSPPKWPNSIACPVHRGTHLYLPT